MGRFGILYGGVCFEDLQSRSKRSELRDKVYGPQAYYAVQVIFMGIDFGTVALFMRSVFQCAELGKGSAVSWRVSRLRLWCWGGRMRVNVAGLLTVWASRTGILGAWQHAG